MAMKLSHPDDGLAENHEINVTPFIDVMLVLLIIFMITASVSTVDIPVQLPDSNAQQQPPPRDPIYVSLQAGLQVAVADRIVPRERLGPALDAATGGDRATALFLRADKSVNYQNLMDLLNGLRDAGYTNVALVGVGDKG